METAHKTDQEKMEFFDSEQELDQKVTILAELIKASKHFVVFTGAGISTSAGIPDFRSGINTVLPTGPGAWEKAVTGAKSRKNRFKCPMTSAIPTLCHMALVKLHEVGIMKFLVSQNTDGLHRKSGIPAEDLAEVHGNINLEVCRNKACNKQYLRNFGVRTAREVHDHATGRPCEHCGEDLYDTIINFGESLPKREIMCGFRECNKADLCLVLGSSLRVTPAADMPLQTVLSGGNLVIVNLQATPHDLKAMRINGLIDDVMGRLMSKLGLDVPVFSLETRMELMKANKGMRNQTEADRPRISKRSLISLFKSVSWYYFVIGFLFFLHFVNLIRNNI